MWWVSLHRSWTLIVLCRVPRERAHFFLEKLDFQRMYRASAHSFSWKSLAVLEAQCLVHRITSVFSWRCINIQVCLRCRHAPDTGEDVAWGDPWALNGGGQGQLGWEIWVLSQAFDQFFTPLEIQLILLCLLNNFAGPLSVCLKMNGLCVCQLWPLKSKFPKHCPLHDHAQHELWIQ